MFRVARNDRREAVQLVEQVTDGLVAVDAADGFAQKFGHGNNRQILQAILLCKRAGICHNDAVDTSLLEAFNRRAAEHCMGGSEEDSSGSMRPHHFDSAADGTGGCDHVIKDQSGLALNRSTDEVCLTSLQSVGASLINNCQ